MKPVRSLFVGLIIFGSLFQATGQEVKIYGNDFSAAAVDSIPEDFLILDGGFAVKEEGGNKFFELPGAPLDTFGFLFGPTAKENWSVSARVHGSRKGRRFPTFSVGLNGQGGYKLQVSPGKKVIELYKADAVLTTVPFEWESDKWTHLQIQIKKNAASWKIDGMAWTEGTERPSQPMISWEEKETPSGGRAYVGASPYSTTPIRVDDLKVEPVK
ncbi:MAG: hypothetical protein SFY81_09570 [Verrucomicrobiota bacterium]|nr:hypothetical protein [Verrucomicrobiota bacterium]